MFRQATATTSGNFAYNDKTQLYPCKPASINGYAASRRWESAFIPGLKFVETSVHRDTNGLHLHDCIEIVWVRNGSCEIKHRNSRYTLNCGNAAIIAPYEIHARSSASAHFKSTTLHIPYESLELLFGKNYPDDSHPLQLAPMQFIDASDAEILYLNLICSLPETLSKDSQITCLKNVMRIFFRPKQTVALSGIPQMNCHPAIARAKFIINKEFTEPIDFYNLAAGVNLHQRYFISLFKTNTGIPPYQYQIALRVEFGRRLLDGDQSLSAIASNAGFADQSHFNRHFKRIYATTPGAFREQKIPM